MFLGLLLIFAAALAYNGSAILLAMAARTRGEDHGAGLLATSMREVSGSVGLGLTLAGWALELLALTRVSMTVDKLGLTIGFPILLGLAAWRLHERIGWREILGLLAIGAGMLVIALLPMHRSGSNPSPGHWVLLSALLLPGVLIALTFRSGPSAVNERWIAMVKAVGAGLGYSLSGLLTKGIADQLHHGPHLWLAILLVSAGAAGGLGFVCELEALQAGRASAVVPIVAALQTIVPILLAPLFFHERWPVGSIHQLVFAACLCLNIAGVAVLSRVTSRIESESEGQSEATDQQRLPVVG